MKTDVSGRTKECAAHRLAYNAEHGNCPLCVEESQPHQLAPAPRAVAAGSKPRFPCPFCGAHSIYQGHCSLFACRKRAGLCKPVLCVNKCIHCGGKTKYPRSCTKYTCRQKAGTTGMYYRPR